MSEQKSTVLITGASGLLGTALVKKFLQEGFTVLAQYHTGQPIRHEDCQWLWADFSDIQGIRDFLDGNRERFKNCGFLVNNYGPITFKPVPELTSGDFNHDFHHNVLTAFEITDFFIKQGRPRVVMNIGFQFTGELRAYEKILTYAAAKNALRLLTTSFQKQYPGIDFHMISPPTIAGAKVPSKSGKKVSPDSVAKEIYKFVFKHSSASLEKT